MSLRFRKQKTVQYFLNMFYTKTRLSQDLLPDMGVLKWKMFPSILHIKSANKVQKVFQNSMKDTMNHFSIIAEIMIRKENGLSCKLKKYSKGRHYTFNSSNIVTLYWKINIENHFNTKKSRKGLIKNIVISQNTPSSKFKVPPHGNYNNNVVED